MRAWAVALVLVTACSAVPERGRPAAEPARSPALTAVPAGRVVAVGAQAEGVAVDPRTHLAAVGVRDPFGIALVDTRTGRLVRTVPVSGHVRHLAVRGSTVLVPLEDTGALLELSLPEGRVLAEVPTDGYPHGVAAVGDDGAVVGNEHGRRVTLVRRGGVVGSAGGFPQPGGLATTPDGVYVVDVAADTLTWLRPGTLSRTRTVVAGDGPTHAVADRRGDVLVVDTRGEAVSVFSPALRLRRSVHLTGTPYGLAYDPVRDQVWVTLTARNELVCLAATDLHEVRRVPTVRQPNTVAVDSGTGTVVVASRVDGLLQLVPS